MLRLLVLGCTLSALLLAGGVGAAGLRPASSHILGTWSIDTSGPTAPDPPWKADDTVTIRASSQAEAVPVIEAWPGFGGGVLSICGESPEEPDSYPNTTWYALTYTWQGGGTLMGCKVAASAFFEFVATSGIWLSMNFGTDGTFFGSWDPTYGPSKSWTLWLTKDKQGTTKTVNAPPPGKSVDVESPPLPSTGTVDVTVSSSQGDGDDLAIFGEGGLEATVTAVWLYCWLANVGRVSKPADRVRACARLVAEFLRENGFKVGGRKPAAATVSRATAASGCGVKHLAFQGRRASKNSKRIISLRPASRKLTANSVRYGCTISGGEMKITVQTGAKGGLRKALGKTLDLRVYRSKQAPKGGKLSITYSW